MAADPVFPSERRDGKPLTERAIGYIVKAAAKRAGINPAVSVYWLRHTRASHALNNGAPDHARLADARCPRCKRRSGTATSPGTRRGLREETERWRSVFPAPANIGDPNGPLRGLSANQIARALISMVARSTVLQSEAGYICARPFSQLEDPLLRRTAGPYIRVKSVADHMSASEAKRSWSVGTATRCAISGSEQSHKGSPPPGVVGPVPSRRCSILSRHPSAKVGDGHERRRRVPHVLSPALRPGLPPKSLERLPLMVVKMIMLPCPDNSNASRSGAASRIVQDARRISSG